jgi:hypothetical protein
MRHSFTTNAITGCIPRGFASAACSNAFTTLLGWLNIVPGILGAAVGAPLVAGEFEQGTFRFAFTQSVPRTRCILVRLLVVVASVVMAGVVFIALLTWTGVPMDQMGSRLNPGAHGPDGLSPEPEHFIRLRRHRRGRLLSCSRSPSAPCSVPCCTG